MHEIIEKVIGVIDEIQGGSISKAELKELLNKELPEILKPHFEYIALADHIPYR